MSLLTFLSFRLLLITSFHVFLGRPLGKLSLTLKVLHLLGQALSFTLSRWVNHCRLLSCKHSSKLFTFCLVLRSVAEIIYSGLMLDIHLTILASFLSSLITSSSLTGQISLPYSITLCTHAEYNLHSVPKRKSSMGNKFTKSFNLHHPLHPILVLTLSNAPSLFKSMPRQSSAMSIC